MPNPTLLVLAAGMGSRYGGLKQMDPVGPSGEVVLDYSVYDAMRAGFGRVVFVVRPEMEVEFRSAIASRFENRIEAGCVHQRLDDLPAGFSLPDGRTKPWGTGHAVLAARDAIREPFAVINADDFYGRDAYQVLAEQLRRHTDSRTYAMVGFRLGNTLSEHGAVSRGVCDADADGNLVSIEEMTCITRTEGGAQNRAPDGTIKALTGNELVSLNMWGFSPSIFAHLDDTFRDFLSRSEGDPKAEFFIPSVVSGLLAGGVITVRVLATTSEWFGVTHRDDKQAVEARIRPLVDAGVYPASLWGR